MASDKIKTLTDSNFDQETKNGVVLVDFWAEWCGPCRMIAPTVEAVAEKYAGSASVAKVNVDENPSISQRYGIRGIPTLILFKGGKEEERIVGAISKEAISRMVEKHLSVT
jgi:thioredoxin 1